MEALFDDLLERNSRARLLLTVLTPLAVGLFFVRAAAHFAYTPDDTYIYLRTAQNLVAGDGLGFNGTGGPASVTGPLWALLVALGSLLRLDPFVTAKALDITCAGLSLLALQSLVLSLTGDRVAAVLAAVIFSFDPWLLRWAGTGMETSLAVLLTLTAVRHVIQADLLSFAGAAGLLTLVRPENVALLPLAAIVFSTGPTGIPWKRWIIPAGIYLLVVGTWGFISLTMTGSIVPATVSAKGGAAWDWTASSEASWTIVRVAGLSVGPLVLVAVAAGVALRARLTNGDRRTLMFLLGWPAVVACGYVVGGVEVVSRYILPALPPVIACAVWLTWRAIEEGRYAVRTALTAFGIAALLTIGPGIYAYARVIVPAMRDFASSMEHGVKPIAYWLRNNAERDAEVLAPDIGMVGYVSELRVWDVAGLATPALRAGIDGIPYDSIMVGRLYRSVVNPTFIIDRSHDSVRLRAPDLVPVMTAELRPLSMDDTRVQFLTLYRTVQ